MDEQKTKAWKRVLVIRFGLGLFSTNFESCKLCQNFSGNSNSTNIVKLKFLYVLANIGDKLSLRQKWGVFKTIF